MTEVSVVIPTYNRQASLREALESVLGQTAPPDEIIIVDDGSSDDTRNQVREYGSRVRYLYQDNRGVAAARNRGISAASGQWIAFLDSDDVWSPRKLEVQLDLIASASPQVACIHSRYVIEGPGYNVLSRLPPRGSSLTLTHLLRRNQVGTSTAIVRKQYVLQIGGFDESLPSAEDWDLWLRLATRRLSFCYSSEPLAYYRIGSEGFVNNLSQMGSSVLAVLDKFFGQEGLPRAIREWDRPARAWAYVRLARDWTTLGNRKAAVEHLRRAARLYPLSLLDPSMVPILIGVLFGDVVYGRVRRLKRMKAP